MSTRVLHISQTAITGTAYCVSDYVSAQVAAGWDVAVVSPPGELQQLVERVGATVVDWSAGRGLGVGLLSELWSLRAVIRSFQPDLVHLHCAKAGLLGRFIIRGKIPTVFSPHAWSFLAVTGFYRRLVREWERFAARWTTAVVCVSAAEAATGRAAGIRGNFQILPNRVRLDEIEQLRHHARGAVRTELGLSLGEPVAVVAARLCEQKGQDIAVEAWPLVREAVPNAQLVLVGDGPDRPAIEAAIAERGVSGVRLVGPADRTLALRWMYAADVVVCPSRWEGMSLVPLEAAALGRPVVAANVDGMAESVPPNAGLLVPKEKPKALADAVGAVLSDPGLATKLGQAARERVKSTDPASVGTALMEIYAGLLRVRSGHAARG